jgi:hypothetical protein
MAGNRYMAMDRSLKIREEYKKRGEKRCLMMILEVMTIMAMI